MPEYGGVANMLALLLVVIILGGVCWAFAHTNKKR